LHAPVRGVVNLRDGYGEQRCGRTGEWIMKKVNPLALATLTMGMGRQKWLA